MSSIISEIDEYFSYTPHLVALLPAVALIVFTAVWLGRYASMDKRSRNALDWVRKGPELPLGIGRRGGLSKGDIAPMLIITALYAAAALFYLGNGESPQTFWKAESGGDSVVIDLGEPMPVESLYYYSGNYHGPNDVKHYEFALSLDGNDYREQTGLSQLHSQTFQWRSAQADGMAARYVRVTALYAPLELGELGVISGGAAVAPSEVTPSAAWTLFDEQDVIPEIGGRVRTPVNGAYFDEIYHVRAAYEYQNNVKVYETTHPPLGKEIIWAGISIFGMTPFGWRIMGALFGILMLPLFYILMKQLFNNTAASAAATAVWAADMMHLTQTRIATIDTYNVFFVLLMFLFMHRWMTQSNDTPMIYTLPPLFLCGLAFGLGVAAKWSSAYAGIGLVALYIWKLVNRAGESKRYGRPVKGFVLGTLACSVVFFIIVPFAVYMLSYIPYAGARGQTLTLSNLWGVMSESQTVMYNYHRNLTSTHVYQSRWYSWLLDIQGICFFADIDKTANSAALITCINNPLLSWGGLAAVICCAANVVSRRCYRALFILIGYLSVLLPWVFISRITFIYHYFPASMFLAAALGYMFWRVALTGRRAHIWAFVAVSAALFVLYYPIAAGIRTNYSYVEYALRWIPSWPL